MPISAETFLRVAPEWLFKSSAGRDPHEFAHGEAQRPTAHDRRHTTLAIYAPAPKPEEEPLHQRGPEAEPAIACATGASS